MSRCFVCDHRTNEFSVVRTEPSWMNEFRAVRVNASGKIWVTGIGCVRRTNIDDWYAPQDYNARWTNPEYDFPESDKLTHIIHAGRYAEEPAFLVHNSCWMLLNEYFRGRNLPLGRLMNLFKSFLESNIFDPVRRSDGARLMKYMFPWARLPDMHPLRFIENFWYVRVDPYSISVLDDRQYIPPPGGEFRQCNLECSRDHEQSCPFDRLPYELLEEVAKYLSVPDALNLRFVCRKFVPLFDSKVFWKARFGRDGERGYLFEISNLPEPQDWRSHYYRTALRNYFQEIEYPQDWRDQLRRTQFLTLAAVRLNTWRIWTSIQQLSEMLRYSLSEVSEKYTRPLPAFDSDEEVAAPVQGEDHTHCSCHCCRRVLLTQTVQLPHNISRISLSTIKLGQFSYLAGLRFLVENGEELCLGYQGGPQTLLDGAGMLNGFVVILDRIGIRAIMPASEVSEEFSVANGVVTLRLAKSAWGHKLSVALDGCKITGIGHSGDWKQSWRSDEKDFRNNQLWRYSVPSAHLQLNPQSLLMSTNRQTRPGGPTQPFNSAVVFGGPHGEYLKYLRSIIVEAGGPSTEVPAAGVNRILFTYTEDNGPSFGQFLGVPARSGYSRIFLIDGPNGERISAFRAVFDRSQNRALLGLMIRTNWGRNHMFHANDKARFRVQQGRSYSSLARPSRFKPLKTAEGTSIVGIQGHSSWYLGISSLGVITIPEVDEQSDAMQLDG